MGYIESGASSTECVGHVSVDLISSGVDVLLGAEKLNSRPEDQETDNTPGNAGKATSHSPSCSLKHG